MALNTESEVRAIVDTQLADISPFLSLAALVVQEELSGKSLTAARLKEIERWLAAHFIVLREELGGITSEESADNVGFTYAQVQGKGYNSTRYGKQACALDTSGSLLSSGIKKARFTVL